MRFAIRICVGIWRGERAVLLKGGSRQPGGGRVLGEGERGVFVPSLGYPMLPVSL